AEDGIRDDLVTGVQTCALPISSDYGAEYGRAGGSYVNIVTKSGANEIHGSVFEYFRNDIFDARNFFAVKTAAKPKFRYNNFGGRSEERRVGKGCRSWNRKESCR